jgi:hypothetical protein
MRTVALICAVVLVVAFGVTCVSEMHLPGDRIVNASRQFQNFTWVVWNEDGSCSSWIVDNYDDDRTVTHVVTKDNCVIRHMMTISTADTARLDQLIEHNDLDSWNGCYGIPGSMGFTLTYTYSDGTTVNASGSPDDREDFQSVYSSLSRYFSALADAYGV